MRESTFKRLKLVPEDYEYWPVSEGSLSSAEITKHLIEFDDRTIKEINEPTLRSILPEKGSIDNCCRKLFSDLISVLEKKLGTES